MFTCCPQAKNRACMYFASLVAAVAAVVLCSSTGTDQANEDTDLRVGRSPAQSLSVNTVRVEHALFCTSSFSPRSCVPSRHRRRRFDEMMSDIEGHARDLARRFSAKALSGRLRCQELTLAHNASKTAILFGTRFLRLIVIIVAIHSKSDHRFCILHAVFVQHACHISCG